MGFPDDADVKESACNKGHLGFHLGAGKIPEKGAASYSSIFARRIP